MQAFAIESWDPSYGVSADETAMGEATSPVELGREVASQDWAPISPAADLDPPSSVVFVDGVRRIDARVWITGTDGRSHPGVCATVGAGAVRCTETEATLATARIERAVYTAAPGAESIETKHGTYVLHSIDVDERTDLTQATNLAVHSHMTEIETSLDVAAEPGELLVFDGPLRGREAAAAAGYIKTQHVQYLPDEQQGVVHELNAGQRTPLFRIGGQFNRWSWYLRLPGPAAHGLSGVVRIELAGLGDAQDAACRADQISLTLPRYASTPHKDTRAPQNLHPIAGLERELRRRLGDPQLLERGLRVAAHEAATRLH